MRLPLPAAATEGTSGGGGHRVPPGKISIQLYTLRDQLAADFTGTLAALAAIGHRRVEHAGGAPSPSSSAPERGLSRRRRLGR